MTSPDDRTWYIIPCPSTVTLTQVDKERGTHGSIYVLWDIDEKSPVWVGQSIPALVRSVNEKAVINKEKRLHASSLYRCLRGEARKQHHKSWKVDKYSRDALQEMNIFLSEFPSVVYVSKSPELWRCTQCAGGEEDGAGSSSSGAARPGPTPQDELGADQAPTARPEGTSDLHCPPRGEGSPATGAATSGPLLQSVNSVESGDGGGDDDGRAVVRSSSSIFDESDGRVTSFDEGPAVSDPPCGRMERS